jgi:predicted RNA-binding protein associated with RNAse of E/G family
MTHPSVNIEYIRPGKETSYYEEDLIFENADYIKTRKHLPDGISDRLSENLRKQGFIKNEQRCEYVTKIYFFNEHFNLLQFQDEAQETLGYYSDIGTPLSRTDSGFQMTDWFLDIWLSPDGTLFELDMDEFEDALSKELMNPAEAEIARNTFARLIEEVRQGIYPQAYLR